jgi:hypothetical protein
VINICCLASTYTAYPYLLPEPNALPDPLFCATTTTTTTTKLIYLLTCIVLACLAVPAHGGKCAPFNGGYEADISLFPDAPLSLCDPLGVEPGKKCLYKDQDAAVTIQEVECTDSYYRCCMQVTVDYSELPFDVVFTNLCYDVTTSGPNTMAECDVAFFGRIGTGTDFYKLVGGNNQLTVTSKTGNEPNNAALGIINGKRVDP